MQNAYSLKAQRTTYMVTMRNDIVLKQYPKNLHKTAFDQYGAGNKVFKQWWNFTLFRFTLDLCLPLVMLLGDLYYPFKYSVKLLTHKRNYYSLKRLYLHHERRLLALSKNAKIQNDDDVWFHNPFDFICLDESYKTLCALDFVTFGEIWKSEWQALLLHLKTIFTLGYDKYLLSLRAYEWCLTDFALRHVPLSVNLTYSSICDRMAILYDNLPHKQKTMIQHGTMHFHNVDKSSPYFTWQKDMNAYTWNSLYKSSPSTVYCYTKDDEIALKRSVIANTPRFVHMGYGFKPSFKPAKKSLLIVGNPSYNLKNERQILDQLQSLDILIYLKNHPAEPNELYEELRKQYQFEFIKGLDNNLPEVNLVISYDSTLAYEYASIGTIVLYYGHFDINNIRDIVVKEMNI